MGLCQGEGLFMLCLFWVSEKFRVKNKLFFIFADLEKAFDWVLRKVIRFALKRKGVPRYLVNVAIFLYRGFKITVSVDGELSFYVKVGVHQESALRPILFIMVMDVLRENVRDGLLMDLLHVDHLALFGE